MPAALRHPSGRGAAARAVPRAAAQGRPAKNRLHLDLRLEAATTRTRVVAGSSSSGGRELDPDWGELPWRVLTDPSGNELCLLPARSA